MFRVANILMVGALLVTAAVVYQLKYASTADAERLAILRTSIRKERDAIAVMRAEWARRTSPFYIQGLVERHLDLKRLDVEYISSLDDLPAKPAHAGDAIGGIIEALEDTPLATSSSGKSSAPTPNGGAPAAASGGAASVPATSAIRPKPKPQPTPVASAGGPAATGSITSRPAPPRLPPPQSSPAAPAAGAPAEPPSPLANFFNGFLSGR